MTKSSLEIADVIRRFMGPYKEQFGDLMLPSHRRALKDISQCMTEAMGGGRYQCNDCHEDFWSYHGCRNRSCPKCHGRQITDWLKNRTAEILPCTYFHVIATVPSELRTLFLRHQKTLYGLLMKIPANVWKRQWCSYSKAYGTGKEAVLDYLARYVFRIAITNHPLVSMDESHVTFRYKDHNTEQWKTERIEGIQFIRRFLISCTAERSAQGTLLRSLAPL